MFDCIVIGAGAAGGATAYHLAKAGRSVMIVEKAALPRYKPCGGAVSPAVAAWFDFDFSPVISQQATTIGYTWKLGDPIEVKLEHLEPVWLVYRDQFDHFLTLQAQAQGAVLQDRTTVVGIQFHHDRWQVNTSGNANQPITGRYLVAADGAMGTTAAWLGLRGRKQRTAAALEIPSAPRVAVATPRYTRIQFEFGIAKAGYAWNFPKAEGYSLGLATFQGAEGGTLRRTVQEYAQALGIDPSASQYYEHPLSLWDGNQILHSQNALVVGEAAGMVDPFTAEGIRPGIASGVQAARAIDRALSGDINALEHYTNVIHNEWGDDFAWAQRLASVFYRIPGISYRVGVKVPAASQKMAEILCGRLQYSSVVTIALKRLSSGLIPGLGR